ncbi:pilus assembly protein [Cellulomonas sp. DKR-3]|uniref:Pilus assembly protein n=1 Tax=Cellulomonas fulva TaxID=2835530 RepID=A0ABS5U273_9CELL|nr:TadE/TadG family type IV pilus assembly protein [Cellulomonas fulva]MBT0995498.1 pilus assembly protein [Cellulomonas fulva]
MTPRRPARDDRGSAVVDFVLVGGLVVVAVLAVVQLALVLHVRSTLVDSASEGARYGAVDGRTPADGAGRTRELITGSLVDSFAQDVTASRIERGGVAMVEVRVTAPLPVVGFVGPGGVLTVTGHAIAEDALP